ncbi:hypothetical protein IB211_02345c [Intestinimonas butyriciproducens]|uniref:Uncharacterized protein n=1 Tax=Intestinimonas butyriciproducens TaxID=1297617 RepID=A0A0S2W6U8_9FIRM|nr:hypothetical protein IB211_02345c [Intestinimonas butyriciproducens]
MSFAIKKVTEGSARVEGGAALWRKEAKRRIVKCMTPRKRAWKRDFGKEV